MNRSNLKQLISEAILSELNENDGNTEMWYALGKKTGIKDKLQGGKRDISKYPEEFQRGYKEIQHESWWNKFNAKLTDFSARLGQSYGRR